MSKAFVCREEMRHRFERVWESGAVGASEFGFQGGFVCVVQPVWIWCQASACTGDSRGLKWPLQAPLACLRMPDKTWAVRGSQAECLGCFSLKKACGYLPSTPKAPSRAVLWVTLQAEKPRKSSGICQDPLCSFPSAYCNQTL